MTGAIVNICLTIGARVASGAQALVPAVGLADAAAAVSARRGRASINLALWTGKACLASARITIDAVCASASIAARIGAAFVGVGLALGARIARATGAAVAANHVPARTTVFARI